MAALVRRKRDIVKINLMKRFKKLICRFRGHKYPHDCEFSAPCLRCGHMLPGLLEMQKNINDLMEEYNQVIREKLKLGGGEINEKL